LYYSGGVTQAEATSVGQRLQAEGFFDGRGAKTVLLSREGGKTVATFVVRKDAVNDPQVLEAYREFARQLSQDIFAGQPVEIHLCDEHLNVQKKLP
jgi:hypothetical protein